MTRLRVVRHLPFYLGLGAGCIGLISSLTLPPIVAVVLAANLFFATYLLVGLRQIARLSAHDGHRRAAVEDEPVWIIFLVTLAAVVIAVAALFVMINGVASHSALDIAMAILAVPLGWLTVHLMAASHYAHLYWQAGPAGEPRRGLNFPATEAPRGTDFLYFALVIGMTAQTSDVEITAQDMRVVNTVHAVTSFLFNTVLVAAAVNVAAGLGK